MQKMLSLVVVMMVMVMAEKWSLTEKGDKEGSRFLVVMMMLVTVRHMIERAKGDRK